MSLHTKIVVYIPRMLFTYQECGYKPRMWFTYQECVQSKYNYLGFLFHIMYQASEDLAPQSEGAKRFSLRHILQNHNLAGTFAWKSRYILT